MSEGIKTSGPANVAFFQALGELPEKMEAGRDLFDRAVKLLIEEAFMRGYSVGFTTATDLALKAASK